MESWVHSMTEWGGKTSCEILTVADSMPPPLAGPRVDRKLSRHDSVRPPLQREGNRIWSRPLRRDCHATPIRDSPDSLRPRTACLACGIKLLLTVPYSGRQTCSAWKRRHGYPTSGAYRWGRSQTFQSIPSHHGFTATPAFRSQTFQPDSGHSNLPPPRIKLCFLIMRHTDTRLCDSVYVTASPPVLLSSGPVLQTGTPPLACHTRCQLPCRSDGCTATPCRISQS